MGLLELPDLRHKLGDIGTTLLCISGYNGLPHRTLPINLIHETVRRSERVGNAALSSAVLDEIQLTPAHKNKWIKNTRLKFGQ